MSTTTNSETMSSVPALLNPEEAIHLWETNPKKVKFVDGSWHMVKSRDPVQEFNFERIIGARRFDIDACSNKETSLPHMLPSTTEFSNYVSALGISSDDHVIVYSTHDCFSAPRVWWTFHAFNHNKVSVLNGGLKAWKAAGGKIESGPVEEGKNNELGDFVATLNPEMVKSVDDVVDIMNSGAAQILDARSKARFLAQAPEPRQGLEGGAIPGSLNLPFTSIVQADDVTSFRSPVEIRDAFVDAGIIFGSKIVLTCGSGVSAAVLSLALTVIGKSLEQSPIYDGSWTEWGGRSDLPKMK